MNLPKRLKANKRRKIIIVSVALTIGLLLTQNINIQFYRYRFIIGLSVFSYLLSLWALWEGMSKLKAITLLILPALFTLGVASFYFLLPVRWLTRLPVAIIFGVFYYSLLLSQNVFNVASERTIPLHRAATTVSFLFTLVTAFFLFNVLFSFRLIFYLNGFFAFLISLPLIVQILWSIEMEGLTSTILVYSLLISILIGEFALVFSFWPIIPTVWSLTLSTLLYVLMGLTTHLLNSRLNKRLVLEYLGVGGVVFLFTLLTTSWVG